MLEKFVNFLIPKAQRTAVSKAVVADTRGAAPFRLQQILFDTAGGVCAERGLYLLADSMPDLHGDRVHRATQPLTACAGIEHAWPDLERQFDQTTLAQLLLDPDAALGPPLELPSPLMPRARLVSRGRRGLVQASDDRQTVIEVVFQRCEFATANRRHRVYRLTLNLLAGDIRALYSQAWQWRQRFNLVLDPHAAYVHAARIAAGKPRRPKRFSAPVWLPDRLLPETVSYPAVSGAVLLVSTASDLAMQVCAIAESDRDDAAVAQSRLAAFEQAVHAADCLLYFLKERSALALPAELTGPLQHLQDSRYEHLVQARLNHWANEAGVESVSVDPGVRAALGVGSATGLRAMATNPLTHQCVLTLLAWCESCARVNLADTAPDEAEQDADRQQLELWVRRVQTLVNGARASQSEVRLQLWQELHRLDEALTLFGSVLPRRLLLRYRMNIRAALVPLTDWLVLSRLLDRLSRPDAACSQAVKRPNWAQEQAVLMAAWQQQIVLADQRVISQLTRLAQTAIPDDLNSLRAR